MFCHQSVDIYWYFKHAGKKLQHLSQRQQFMLPNCSEEAVLWAVCGRKLAIYWHFHFSSLVDTFMESAVIHNTWRKQIDIPVIVIRGYKMSNISSHSARSFTYTFLFFFLHTCNSEGVGEEPIMTVTQGRRSLVLFWWDGSSVSIDRDKKSPHYLFFKEIRHPQALYL